MNMNNVLNNRWITLITFLLLTANIGTLALLWTKYENNKRKEGRPGPPPPNGQVFEFISNELNFDSTQREAYRQLRDKHQDGKKPIEENIQKAKDDLFSLLKKGKVDSSEIWAAAKRASEATMQMDLFTFEHFQKVRGLCNTVQQPKFDSIIKDVLKKIAPKRRMPPGPPPPGPDRQGPRDFSPPPNPGHEPPSPPENE